VSENEENTNSNDASVEVVAETGEVETSQTAGGSRKPLVIGTIVSVLVIAAVAATLMFAFGGSRSNLELKKATNDSFVAEYHGAMALLSATNTCTNYQCVNKAATAAITAQEGAIAKLGGGFPSNAQKKYDAYKADLVAIADTYKALETAKSQAIVAQFYSQWQTQFRTSAHDGYVLLHAIGK
jgi:hypothetical protein